MEKLNAKMDALYLIKKMMEIDKLKMLLLTPDQINLFNYLPKPKIMMDENINNQLSRISISTTERHHELD